MNGEPWETELISKHIKYEKYWPHFSRERSAGSFGLNNNCLLKTFSKGFLHNLSSIAESIFNRLLGTEHFTDVPGRAVLLNRFCTHIFLLFKKWLYIRYSLAHNLFTDSHWNLFIHWTFYRRFAFKHHFYWNSLISGETWCKQFPSEKCYRRFLISECFHINFTFLLLSFRYRFSVSEFSCLVLFSFLTFYLSLLASFIFLSLLVSSSGIAVFLSTTKALTDITQDHLLIFRGPAVQRATK